MQQTKPTKPGRPDAGLFCDKVSFTKVVHCKRESYDVYIGRPSIWGNPFVLGRDGNRREVIDKFRTYIESNKTLLSKISSLRGKRLGCFCYPLACHGDVLAELANAS